MKNEQNLQEIKNIGNCRKLRSSVALHLMSSVTCKVNS